MDWAGTAVDYGCFAPVAAFVECFKAMGLNVSPAETRAHMGLTKLEEIRALFAIGHVSDEFAAKYGRAYNEDDVQQCYRGFQEAPEPTLSENIIKLQITDNHILSTMQSKSKSF